MAEAGNVVATTAAVDADRHMASEAASAAMAVFNLFMMAGALISPLCVEAANTRAGQLRRGRASLRLGRLGSHRKLGRTGKGSNFDASFLSRLLRLPPKPPGVLLPRCKGHYQFGLVSSRQSLAIFRQATEGSRAPWGRGRAPMRLGGVIRASRPVVGHDYPTGQTISAGRCDLSDARNTSGTRGGSFYAT